MVDLRERLRGYQFEGGKVPSHHQVSSERDGPPNVQFFTGKGVVSERPMEANKGVRVSDRASGKR